MKNVWVVLKDAKKPMENILALFSRGISFAKSYSSSFSLRFDFSDNTVAIVVPVVLVVMLSVFLLLIYWLRRNKSTIKQMRKTIGEKMVGEVN